MSNSVGFVPTRNAPQPSVGVTPQAAFCPQKGVQPGVDAPLGGHFKQVAKGDPFIVKARVHKMWKVFFASLDMSRSRCDMLGTGYMDVQAVPAYSQNAEGGILWSFLQTVGDPNSPLAVWKCGSKAIDPNKKVLTFCMEMPREVKGLRLFPGFNLIAKDDFLNFTGHTISESGNFIEYIWDENTARFIMGQGFSGSGATWKDHHHILYKGDQYSPADGPVPVPGKPDNRCARSAVGTPPGVPKDDNGMFMNGNGVNDLVANQHPVRIQGWIGEDPATGKYRIKMSQIWAPKTGGNLATLQNCIETVLHDRTLEHGNPPVQVDLLFEEMLVFPFWYAYHTGLVTYTPPGATVPVPIPLIQVKPTNFFVGNTHGFDLNE